MEARSLTVRDRCDCQRTIEEVLWKHRIWPKENNTPKPELDQIMPESEISLKVERYLENFAKLQANGNTITHADLDIELDRIIRDTKDPELLEEILNALGNNRLLIRECFVGPTFVERISGSDLSGIENGIGSVAGGAPAARRSHTAVWTRTEMIVWNGSGGAHGAQPLRNGAIYSPATDSWRKIATGNSPAATVRHTAVWTGIEMLVWGGIRGGFPVQFSDTGGAYNPVTNTWRKITNAGQPDSRISHIAVWTGTEMIIWGGIDSSNKFTKSGARYDPSTDTWNRITTKGAPACFVVGKSNSECRGVWTGNEMVAFFVEQRGTRRNLIHNLKFHRYDPVRNKWSLHAFKGVDLEVLCCNPGSTVVWTGEEVIGWSGFAGFNNGFKYNPAAKTLQGLNKDGSVGGNGPGIWTGKEMLIWGDRVGFCEYKSGGGLYNPQTDQWRPVLERGAPLGRYDYTIIATDTSAIVWGGITDTDTDCNKAKDRLFNTGGIYNIKTGKWISLN